MRARWKVTALIALALPLAACATSVSQTGGGGGSTPPALADTAWQLDQYAPVGRTTLVPVPEDVSATAEFTADRITGSAGCNSFTGGYTIDGSTLDIGPVAATLMACLPAVAEVEQGYLAQLEAATAYAVADEVLSMSNPAGDVILTFSAATPVPLAGTTWLATGINNGHGGVASLVQGTSVSAVFDDEESLAGDAGCNRYGGPYVVRGDHLTIGDLATTRRACEPEVTEQESQYLAALGATRTFTITRDRLELRDRSGALQVSFTAAE